MLDEHYAGLINIADYWVVGDTRTESITVIPSGTTGEAQSAQSIELVILGMNHDDLADGTGKAAVTVQTKNQLGTAGYMNSSAYENLDGYLWSKAPRRTWCNNKFKSALPDWIQTLIKSTTKLSNRHATTDYSASLYRGQTTTTDEVFLLSEFETFGSAPYSGSAYGDVGSDGTQYEYMKVKANRIKSGPGNHWWLRSGLLDDDAYAKFVLVYSSDGSANYLAASQSYGIAPAFCL